MVRTLTTIIATLLLTAAPAAAHTTIEGGTNHSHTTLETGATIPNPDLPGVCQQDGHVGYVIATGECVTTPEHEATYGTPTIQTRTTPPATTEPPTTFRELIASIAATLAEQGHLQ